MIVWILKGSVRYNEVSPITPNGRVGPRTFLKFIRAQPQPQPQPQPQSPSVLCFAKHQNVIRETWSTDEDLEKNGYVPGARNHLRRMSTLQDTFGVTRKRNHFPAQHAESHLRDSKYLSSNPIFANYV
jgi:hypothetical protein